MDYYEARRIRKQGFTSALSRKLAEGDRGIFSSIGATISERQKARMVGLKEKFDPLNIAKFLTGGSKLGPAILGNLLGRTKSDISYFTGQRPTSTKINRLESDNAATDMLGKILTYMQNVNEENRKNKQKENNFKEELELERLKRHKELIAALSARQSVGTATVVKVEQQGQSLFDIITDMFGVAGGAITAFKWLGRLGGFLASPLALGGLTVVGIAYAMYKMLSDPKGYEASDSDLNRGIAQAEKVGGLAGIKDMMEKRSKLPEYERTMEEIRDFQKFSNDGVPANDAQLSGFAQRGPESARAVADYKKMRDAGEIPTMETVLSNTPSEAVNLTPEIPNVPPPIETAPQSGQQLERTQADNLNLKIQEKTSDTKDVMNINKLNKAQTDQKPTMDSLPPVRNLEPTLESMILSNTRPI